ncbi:ABC transporter ATP-binding protein [Nakamurella lactea]|uniref:ABC transporter ATP-binding protein n=1 Tax=Nakamurella lactea TaxID=459515 RepID=UPI0003F4E981|nr:oligopeptide/dipeptide ABC transporter ATP-binding protein [Nakamurella lactea]
MTDAEKLAEGDSTEVHDADRPPGSGTGTQPAAQIETTSTEPVLRVQNLVKHFPIRRGVFGKQVGAIHAVDDVSFDLYAGRTLGLVGESGSGKTTTGRAVIRLVEPTAGSVMLDGRPLTAETRAKDLARGMSMVFQDPMGSLNPRLSAVANVAEPLRIHKSGTAVERRARATELLDQVGLRADQVERVPAEFSGGQRQRIGIARALALSPKVIILDEPASALDVSVQAQVLNLLRRLQSDLGIAFLFISHDLSVVRHLCDRVAVMYLGEIVEIGDQEQIFTNPLHPYTQALLSAVPIPDPDAKRERIVLKGDLPSPVDPPAGCRFAGRCHRAQDICDVEAPVLKIRTGAQPVACHFPGPAGGAG